MSTAIVAILMPVMLLALILGFILVLIQMFRSKTSSAAAEAGVTPDLVAALDRMENRIATLERILDAEDPKWRGRL